EIAPSRRLYAGGGSSVRGYGYQAVGPRNDFGQPTGGRSLVELSAEARIGTGLFDGALQVVPFFDLGAVSIDDTPDFRFVRYGAGIGVRYETGFGPIRVDLGVPLNREKMFDSAFAVYVSLGQAF
ncbi:MAG: BamA/TamA family outer membrane protein, partial [Erythrobacter sp.]